MALKVWSHTCTAATNINSRLYCSIQGGGGGYQLPLILPLSGFDDHPSKEICHHLRTISSMHKEEVFIREGCLLDHLR